MGNSLFLLNKELEEVIKLHNVENPDKMLEDLTSLLRMYFRDYNSFLLSDVVITLYGNDLSTLKSDLCTLYGSRVVDFSLFSKVTMPLRCMDALVAEYFRSDVDWFISMVIKRLEILDY